MSSRTSAFFTEFLDDYFAESEEHLAAARQHLTLLETSAQRGSVDLKSVEELLRNFHSVKGLAAMVGFEDITQIAHRLEDYLRNLKEPAAIIHTEDVEQFFQTIESVEQALSARQKNQVGPDLRGVLLSLDRMGSGVAAVVNVRAGALPSAVPTPGSVKTWRFEFRPAAELAAAGVTVTTVRGRLERLGKVIEASPRIRDGGSIVFEFVVATDLDVAAFQTLTPLGVTYSKLGEAPVPQPAPEEPAAPAPSSPAAGSNLVRVDMRRLDELMRLVGELVISRAHLDQTLDSAQKNIPASQWRQLEEINSSMGRQMRELRESVMRVRMVPIGQVFERMRFVMRGLERESQKRIRLEIQGHQTEIDKMVVERIMDPMLHLVRNAVSHGIETPAEREAAGKPAEAMILLKATGEGETVLIEIVDDGRGIDLAAVQKRARELGLLQPDEQMSPAQVLDVISAPGFSTRETADLDSGRGVGMAVVRNTVQELSGTISVDTAAGKGTRFAIRLPLTLAIADALLVESANQRYAIPQAAVREVVPVDGSAIVRFENNEVIPYRGGVLTVIRLRRIFGLPGKAPARFHVLILAATSENVGLVVDRVVGHREIVIRAIADPLMRVPAVSGATELGDGRPILILDGQALIRLHAARSSA